MANYIHSTLTNSQNYAVWEELPNGQSRIVKDIHINGGHGLTNTRLELVQGAVTEVSDEDMAHLENNHAFLAHVKNGFIVVSKTGNKDKVLSDLQQRDNSAPGSAQDIEKMYEDRVIEMPVEVMDRQNQPRTRRAA